MTWKEFCNLVREVLDNLPQEIKCQLENVIVDVEEGPSEEVLRAVGLTDEQIRSGETIYGLFEPIVPGLWSEGIEPHTMPHRIVIFKRPLEEDFTDPRQLRIEIRKTVVHELAHHFGWTDRDLERFDNTSNPFPDDRLGTIDHGRFSAEGNGNRV